MAKRRIPSSLDRDDDDDDDGNAARVHIQQQAEYQQKLRARMKEIRGKVEECTFGGTSKYDEVFPDVSGKKKNVEFSKNFPPFFK